MRWQATCHTPSLLEIIPYMFATSFIEINFWPFHISLYTSILALCTCDAFSLKNPDPINVTDGQSHNLQLKSSSMFEGDT